MSPGAIFEHKNETARYRVRGSGFRLYTDPGIDHSSALRIDLDHHIFNSTPGRGSPATLGQPASEISLRHPELALPCRPIPEPPTLPVAERGHCRAKGALDVPPDIIRRFRR